MIEVKNLVKKYGNHVAVDHLSFSVEQGQIYGFLGPNGAGKSTTMNIMTGYLGATEGEVLINGHDILKEPELAKQCIGYLPEIPPLYLEMTVMEYLEFVAELKKIEKNARKYAIDEVLALARLEDVSKRLIKNLSKGYKQRVGLAQAILGLPEIIILDEPTVGLDPKQIIEIRELIRELAQNHTVILSSHILAEVREVCDHILIISQGKLVACDTPENLEKLMAAETTIELEVKAQECDVEEILSGIEGVGEWECTFNADGNLNVKIMVQAEEDLRESVFFAFAEAKCPILMMQKTSVSLEEVFLELTEGKKTDEPEVNELEESELEEVEEGGEPEDESDI